MKFNPFNLISKALKRWIPKSKTQERTDFLKKIINFAHHCGVAGGGGDYLEFGVFKGSNFSEVYRIAKAKKLTDMRFFAFDSFEGLPEGSEKEFGQFAEGEYSASLERFNANLQKSGVDLKDVQAVKGWFKDMLNAETKKRLGLKSAAIIWIDSDLYESAVPVLDFITDLVVDGTILVFDDWFFFKGNPNRGEQRAFREWLA
ncbi:MAG: TylF/MycF/NovP-related O-methyltransferase, partial [Patescibacteria group bacterium]